MYKKIWFFKKICPNCKSKNTVKDNEYDGYTKYTCKDCMHSWTE